MTWFCAHCGSPNQPHMPNCGVCGSAAVAGQVQTQMSHGQQAQQAGFGAPGAGGAYGGSPGAPQAAPPYSMQQGPLGVGGPPIAPPGKKSDSSLKVGCGIAGCLGAGLVIASVIGVIIIFSAGSRSAPDDDSSSSAGGKKKSRKSGGVRAASPDRVGKFRAVRTRPLQVPNAIDSVLVVYRSGGVELEHAVAVFPSTDAAQTNLLASIKRIAKDSPVSGKLIRIKSAEGDVIGLGTHFKGNPESFVYRVGKQMGIIQGPSGEVLPFFQKLP
jgi:hypothetical protein